MHSSLGGVRYPAFISYSHADARFAGWLHRALEHYAVPRGIAGSAGRHGEVPARLFPIFRDREELASAADLPARIEEALAASQALVVVCSPAAAASRWVGQEIDRFIALHGAERLFCIVADGEPPACFPSALQAANVEPIAADARPQGDGRDGALLKLLAGLLGVDLDRLRQRDQVRRRRRNQGWAAAALALIALLGGAAWYANLRRIDAEAASERAERAATAERTARDAEREARVLAEQREQEASRARDAEAQQRGRAEAQRRLAEQQRDLAARRQQVAMARQLAAQADRIRSEQPAELELAALLAVEASRRLDTLETQQALLAVRQVLPAPPTTLARGFSMAGARFSADAAHLVLLGVDGLSVHAAGTDTAPRWQAANLRDGEWALTADGCCLLSWQAREGWRLRRLADGQDIVPAPPYLAALRDVRVGYRGDLHFSADGRLLAAGGTVLRVPDGTLAAPAQRGAALAADGRSFALSHRDRVTVYNSSDGALRAEIELGGERRVWLSPDGSLLLVASDKRREVFDVATRTRLYDLACENPAGSYARFASGSRLLALACDNDVLLLDAPSGTPLGRLAHDRPVVGLQFDAGARRLLSAGYDRTARLWDLATQRETWRATHAGSVVDAKFAPDGRGIVTAGVAGIQRWPLDPAPDLLAELPRPIARLALSADGRHAAASTFEPLAETFVIDIASGAMRWIERGNGRTVALAFSPDSQQLLVADGASLRVHSLAGEAGALWSWPGAGNTTSIAAAAFRNDGSIAIAVGSVAMGSVPLLQHCRLPAAGQPARCQPRSVPWSGPLQPNAFFDASAEHVIFAASNNPGAALLHIGPRGETRSPAPLRVNAVAFAGDQQYVAYTAGRLVERLAAAGRPALPMAHDGWVHHLVLAPDGRHLAAALADPVSRAKNRVVIWRTDDGQEVARFPRPGEYGGMAFSRDGRQLAYIDGPRLRLVNWQAADAAAAVCPRLARNLSCSEWRQWLGDEPYRASCPQLAPAACTAAR